MIYLDLKMASKAQKLKPKRTGKSVIRVTEIFYSIQGEGLHIGLPTVFIRTAGCNLSCSWCDTAYARDFEDSKNMAVSDIVEEVRKYPCKLVCITGGEPLIQKLSVRTLMRKLLKLNYSIDIETNGSISLNTLPRTKKLFISMDLKCPSSKMDQKMIFSNLRLLKSTDQLKFVIANLEDYDYAKNIIARYHPVCNIILMPVYRHGIELKLLAAHMLKDSLKARVLIQMHKIIWGEKRRGV